MASRRSSTKHSKRDDIARDVASERWLLLIFVIAAIILLSSLLEPEAPSPGSTPVKPLTMAQARASNAAVPIMASKRVPASPFVFRGGTAERAQAVDWVLSV